MASRFSTRLMPKGKCRSTPSIDLSAGQTVSIQADYLPYAAGYSLRIGHCL